MSRLLLPNAVAAGIRAQRAKIANVYRFTWLKFWAQDGMVCIVDEKQGSVQQISPDTARARARALGDQSFVEQYAGDRRDLENAANDIMKCAAEATAQGCPLDPGTNEYLNRHLPRNTSMPTPEQSAKWLSADQGRRIGGGPARPPGGPTSTSPRGIIIP